MIDNYQLLISGVNLARVTSIKSDYLNYILYERDYYCDKLANINQFLKSYTKDACYIQIPTKYLLDNNTEVEIQKHYITIPVDLLKKLRIYAKNNEFFLEEILTGAFIRSLSHYTINDTFFMQMMTTGEATTKFADTIGPKLQERLLKVNINKTDTPLNTLQKLHENYITAMEYPNYPLSYGISFFSMKALHISRFTLSLMRKTATFINWLIPQAKLDPLIITSTLNLLIMVRTRLYTLLVPKVIRNLMPKKAIHNTTLVINFKQNIDTHAYGKPIMKHSKSAIVKMVPVTYHVCMAFAEYILITVEDNSDGSFDIHLRSFFKDEINIEILENIIKDLHLLIS